LPLCRRIDPILNGERMKKKERTESSRKKTKGNRKNLDLGSKRKGKKKILI
jgi:hypothetical protein